MALAIKNTPILESEASERFNRLTEEQKDQKVSEEEKKRIKELVEKAISNNK